jgi:HK97 family phage prohead protease
MSEHQLETLSGGETVYRAADPASMHLREEEGQQPILEGRMMPYDEWTEVHSSVEGHFLEKFTPGALGKTITERASRIRALFEHGRGFLDKQPIAEIEDMRDEPDGAHYRAALLDGLPPLLIAGLRRGLYGSSIRFRPIKWDRAKKPPAAEHNPDRLPEHTIREAQIVEFSVVTFPQYAGATAHVRSITDEVLAEKLLDDPKRFLEIIEARNKEETSEPQHPERETPEAPVSERGRSTQPQRDYLLPEKGEPKWLL